MSPLGGGRGPHVVAGAWLLAFKQKTLLHYKFNQQSPFSGQISFEYSDDLEIQVLLYLHARFEFTGAKPTVLHLVV